MENEKEKFGVIQILLVIKTNYCYCKLSWHLVYDLLDWRNCNMTNVRANISQMVSLLLSFAFPIGRGEDAFILGAT